MAKVPKRLPQILSREDHGRDDGPLPRARDTGQARPPGAGGGIPAARRSLQRLHFRAALRQSEHPGRSSHLPMSGGTPRVYRSPSRLGLARDLTGGARRLQSP